MQSEIDLLKQRIAELKVKAENVELKVRIAKLEQTAEGNTELKDRITKLEQKQTQAINKQELSPTKDISPLILMRKKPETSTISLLQDIIDADSAEILDFVKTIHKEKISKVLETSTSVAAASREG
ncbi:hypothetical protein Glove_375g5 [Diversispora epigaea]|uniref:Uncharacterized protein n=1 Tax=Diversispora epigaea TaxID=1348612 RepID=A0A397H8B8_9GLOM|nr:hypothetical protein Glove_375g5 [Diversispora epigaea]